MIEQKIKMIQSIRMGIENYLENNSFLDKRNFILTLTDEDLLFNIAKNEIDCKLRKYAVSKLKNEENLLYIALNDDNKEVKIEAILNDNLKNHSYFESIITSNDDPEIKHYAIVGVENIDLLFEAAINFKYIVDREFALIKLLDLNPNKEIVMQLSERIPDKYLQDKIAEFIKKHWPDV